MSGAIIDTTNRAIETAGTGQNSPALAYLAGLKERSRHVLGDDLADIAALLMGVDPAGLEPKKRRALILDVPWHKITVDKANAIRAMLLERYTSHNTINRKLSALRGVLKTAWEQGLMSGEDYYRAISVKTVKGESLPAGRDLAQGERVALFDVCARDNSPAGYRDAALLACADEGLRRSEIAGLTLADYDPDTPALTVIGKGGKARIVQINPGSARAINDWIAIRGTEPGALLHPVKQTGVIERRHMTAQAVYNAIKKRGDQAGLKDFSPHDFRRTYAGDLLSAGADIVTVQKLMGHSDVTTTARYDRRPEEAKRKAANLRMTPYRGRN